MEQYLDVLLNIDPQRGHARSRALAATTDVCRAIHDIEQKRLVDASDALLQTINDQH